MAGENCTLSISGYGKRKVVATRVVHGVSLFNFGSNEDESRTGKHFHISKRTSGSFDLTLEFSTHERYQDTMQWLEDYGRWIADPRTPVVPIRVTVPSRRFDKIAMLESGVSYGQRVGEVVYTTVLQFMGSSDPVGAEYEGLSDFQLPESKDLSLIYLYPAGTQLGGKAAGLDARGGTEFDGPPPSPSQITSSSSSRTREIIGRGTRKR